MVIITNTHELAVHNAAADASHHLSPERIARIKDENAQRLAWWLDQPKDKREAFLAHFRDLAACYRPTWGGAACNYCDACRARYSNHTTPTKGS
jgi:hypothetical protein